MRERTWVVGERMHPPSSSSTPFEPRAARLEARLALYAQYATLVADEVEAAWSGDPAQAGSRTRELAEERAELAERYEALRPGVGVEPGTDGFHEVLADAVTELDQQTAIEQSLRARLDELHHGGRLLGSGPATEPGTPGTALVRQQPGGEVFGGRFEIDGQVVSDLDTEVVHGSRPDAAGLVIAENDAAAAGENEGRTALPPEIGGALIVARSRGVGGALAGQFPGIVAGADATAYVTSAVAEPTTSPRARVDFTF